MNPIKTVAALLLVADALVFAYGGLDYTKRIHEAKPRSAELSIGQDGSAYRPACVEAGRVESPAIRATVLRDDECRVSIVSAR